MSQADIEAQRKALLELVDAEEKNLLAEYYSGRLKECNLLVPCADPACPNAALTSTK